MRYFGMSLIFLAAFLFSHTVCRALRRRLAEEEGYLSLLRFMRGELTRYARPVNEWCTQFRSEALEESGFLPHLRRDGDLLAAYGASSSSLGGRERELLTSLFSSFGKGYREEEIGALTDREAEFSAMVAEKKEALSKAERVVHTLCASVSLIAVILLL